MVVMHYEEIKLRQLEIEVKALVALLEQDNFHFMRIDAAHRLCEIAFPERLAEIIEGSKQETLE